MAEKGMYSKSQREHTSSLMEEGKKSATGNDAELHMTEKGRNKKRRN